MGKKTIWYSTEESQQRFAVSVPETFDTVRPREQQAIAEICAADYHAEHDGHDSDWPLDFALYESESGEAFARMLIERDFEPAFMARHAKPNA